ncbi:MAG: fused MFS/spermidine synthase [Patescibacteria group bacterium]
MNLILYIIAFLEGFTTLSVEIMAIRNSIAIIGSNAIATSIILGIILLALSYGYYRGGVYAASHTETEIKRKIFFNLIGASIIYTLVSFPLENTLLEYSLSWGIGYFVPVFTTISVLFVFPVFLASQTIPLLSELIHGEQKAIILGKLLFFSTIGSFLGSVVTSLVFFAYIGVEKSIIVNGIILAILSFIILVVFYSRHASRWMFGFNIAYLILLFLALFYDFSLFRTNTNEVYRQSTQYNDIVIDQYKNRKLFSMNGSNSSGLDITTGKSYFSYIQDITRIIDTQKPKKILVIGAAGFTLPQDIAGRDYVEQVDVCDIDGALDTIAEEHFLGEKLHPKIHFYKQSARYFIREKILA